MLHRFAILATRFSALGFWITLAIGVLEYFAVLTIYSDLAEHAVTGPIAALTTLLGTAALPLGVAALLAACLTAVLGAFLPERAACLLGPGLSALGALLVLGVAAVSLVYPDTSILHTNRANIAYGVAVGGALVGAVVFGLLMRRRALVPLRSRTVVAGALLWAIALLGVISPFGFRAGVQSGSSPRLACVRPPGTPAPLSGAPVVLVTVDTLRASHMSLFGYPRGTTPGIDARSAEGTVFTRAMTPKSSTSPALATLHTGLYPDAHGVMRNGVRLSEALGTVAERMAEAGYHCAGFVTNPYVCGKKRGFRQGFHQWRGYGRPPYSARDIATDAMAWIRAEGRSRVFLWVHVADPHTPYRPPAPYDRMFAGDELSRRFADVSFEIVDGRTNLGEVNPDGTLGKGWQELGIGPAELRSADFYVARYDGEIALTDVWITKLIDVVRKEMPEALLILASDHGESMVEHDHFFFHSRFCYDTTAQVPLVVWNPQSRGPERTDRLVNLVDLFPTLCDLVGISPPDRLEGRSFADVWHPELDARSAEREGVLVGARSSFTHPIRGIRTDRWKLIMTPRRVFSPLDLLLQRQLRLRPGGALLGSHLLRSYRTELYDFRADPGETEDVSGEHPELVARLRRALVTAVQGHCLDRLALNVTGDEASFDEDEIEELRALGYLR